MKYSAGLLLYRGEGARLEVFLVHPGGPFWAKKDEGAWSITKGEYESDEDVQAAARREFREETGLTPPEETYADLGSFKVTSSKEVRVWAVRAGNVDPKLVKSNTFTMEWPPRSGKSLQFPEVDRAAWFGLAVARKKIHKGQAAMLDALLRQPGI